MNLLYLSPSGADFVLIVDPYTNTTDNSTLRGFGLADGKWSGVAFDQSTRCLVFAPFTANYALVVDVGTPAPTAQPTRLPTAQPSDIPTAQPTTTPTAQPTFFPTTYSPSFAPTSSPSVAPSSLPTATPTVAPTDLPTAAPTSTPTSTPTEIPTSAPTMATITTSTSGSGGGDSNGYELVVGVGVAAFVFGMVAGYIFKHHHSSNTHRTPPLAEPPRVGDVFMNLMYDDATTGSPFTDGQGVYDQTDEIDPSQSRTSTVDAQPGYATVVSTYSRANSVSTSSAAVGAAPYSQLQHEAQAPSSMVVYDS